MILRQPWGLLTPNEKSFTVGTMLTYIITILGLIFMSKVFGTLVALFSIYNIIIILWDRSSVIERAEYYANPTWWEWYQYVGVMGIMVSLMFLDYAIILWLYVLSIGVRLIVVDIPLEEREAEYLHKRLR